MGMSAKILYCCARGLAASAASTNCSELLPMSARGRIMTRMKRLGRSAACANTGSGPLSYQAPPGPYEVERPAVSMRMPPSIRQRMPGPWWRWGWAQPPGGNTTLSPRRRSSPAGSVASGTASFWREVTPAGVPAGGEAKSKRQQVAPVLPATSVDAPSPCQASPSRNARPAIVAPPCTRKIMRAAAGSASAAPSDNTSSYSASTGGMGVFSAGGNDHCSNDSAVVHRRSRELGVLPFHRLGALPPPRAGEGWGGGELARVLLHAPSLSLQPKSDLSDFGQLISCRTRVNPSSAAGGGGDAVAQ